MSRMMEFVVLQNVEMNEETADKLAEISAMIVTLGERDLFKALGMCVMITDSIRETSRNKR